MKLSFCLYFFLGLTALLCLSPQRASAKEMQELWDRYQGSMEMPSSGTEQKAPGMLFGKVSQERLDRFWENWAYRTTTFELHYEDSTGPARSVYALALYTGDIDSTMTRERFQNGVRGFHYSTAQICTWLNDVLEKKQTLTNDEVELLAFLLKQRVITLYQGRFAATGTVRHVLASAPGQQHSFEENLAHERLHVLWDEQTDFRNTMISRWKQLSGEAQKQIEAQLSAYSQKNELKLIEEWAVREALKDSQSWLKLPATEKKSQ